MEYTVTRAMSLLKTLEARYAKKCGEAQTEGGIIRRRTASTADTPEAPKLIAVQHGNNLRSPFSSYRREDFENEATASFQSIRDLRKRIIKIKVAIAKSNCDTTVTIGGETMSVMEAIIMKRSIDLWKMEYEAEKKALAAARKSHEEALNENKKQVESLLLAHASATTAEKKSAEEKYQTMIDTTCAVSFVDPNGIQSSIEKLEEEIQNLDTELDYVLSESNATTLIEIPD